VLPVFVWFVWVVEPLGQLKYQALAEVVAVLWVIKTTSQLFQGKATLWL
jgi:hypothetical protein